MSTTTTTTTPQNPPAPTNPWVWVQYHAAKRGWGQQTSTTKSSKLVLVGKTIAYLAVVALTAFMWYNGLFSLAPVVTGAIIALLIVVAVMATKKIRNRPPSDPNRSRKLSYVAVFIAGAITATLVIYFGGIFTGLIMTGVSMFTSASIVWSLLVVLVAFWLIPGNRVQVTAAAATTPAPGSSSVAAVPANPTGAPTSPTTPVRVQP